MKNGDCCQHPLPIICYTLVSCFPGIAPRTWDRVVPWTGHTLALLGATRYVISTGKASQLGRKSRWEFRWFSWWHLATLDTEWGWVARKWWIFLRWGDNGTSLPHGGTTLRTLTCEEWGTPRLTKCAAPEGNPPLPGMGWVAILHNSIPSTIHPWALVMFQHQPQQNVCKGK